MAQIDESVRQFGANTCEVGYGLPSGHMQVTVAVYALVALRLRSRRFALIFAAATALTGLSRIHMGAHTPFQVLAGLLAGATTAATIRAAAPFLAAWSRLRPALRAAFALAVSASALTVASIEHAVLSAAGLDPDRSVRLAIAACRGGLHAVVGNFRGVARDCGALVGFAVGFGSSSAPAPVPIAAAGVWELPRTVAWLASLEAARWATSALEAAAQPAWAAAAAAAGLSATGTEAGAAGLVGLRYAALAWWGAASGRRLLALRAASAAADGGKKE